MSGAVISAAKRTGRLLWGLPWLFSAKLDANPEELIERGLRHAKARGLANTCVAASFPLTPEEIEALRARPGVHSVVVKNNPNDSDLPKSYTIDPFVGHYWEPDEWRLPKDCRHVVFVGSWRLITRRMVAEAARHGVRSIACRVARHWLRFPTSRQAAVDDFLPTWRPRLTTWRPRLPAWRPRVPRWPPVAGLLAAPKQPNRLLYDLRWVFDRRLDAKPEELIASGLDHVAERRLPKVCLATSFSLAPEQIEALRTRPGVHSVVTKDYPDSSDLWERFAKDSQVGFYWEPGRWSLPPGCEHVLFVGSWRLVTREMVAVAARHGVRSITCRAARRWIRIPTPRAGADRQPSAPWRPRWRGLASSGRGLVRLAYNFRWIFDRRLDAKPEEVWAAALDDARRRGLSQICIAASFPMDIEQIDALLQDPIVASVVHKDNPNHSRLPADRVLDPAIGFYWEPGLWRLPEVARDIYFIGHWRLLTRWMLWEAYRRDVRAIHARCARAWLTIPMRYLRLFKRLRRVRSVTLPDPTPAMFRSILAGSRPRRDYVPGRVVHVCGSLAPGGAERQVLYTMAGLRRRGIGDTLLLCDHLTPNHPAKYDFYLPKLRAAGVEARTIRARTYNPLSPNRGLPQPLAREAKRLPAGLVSDIADLYRELLELKPEVVHAWLDWSNVRAGLAAALAGVPHVLLSGRNLNPSHFGLYQSYMDPAYVALAEHPGVRLLNNSEAGAHDYESWLGLDAGRITVIHNGVDFGDAVRVPDQEVEDIKSALGFAHDAPLVGGIFRLYPEKRPLLWLEVAALVAAERPEVRFIVYGEGVMREELEDRSARLGLTESLRFPGVTDSVLPILSAMDVFLLTSYGEGLPNVVLEAQWAGTPVVATDAGGTREAVDEDVTGWIVDQPDARQLADRVLALLNDRKARRKCRRRGPAFVRERFGVDRMIDETLGAYGYAGNGATGAGPDDVKCSA